MNVLDDIQMVHERLQGWCSWLKAETLASIVVALRPKISVEIGVFGGRSLIPIAMAHRYINHGKVIGIDPWMARASVEGQLEADAKWWSDQKMHDDVYTGFMRFRENLQLQQWIQVERKVSDEFDPMLGIGLLHVDGNHGEQAIKDVERFCPFVDFGGIVVVDDIGWGAGTVDRAIDLLPRMGFIEKYRVKDEGSEWGVYQKIK